MHFWEALCLFCRLWQSSKYSVLWDLPKTWSTKHAGSAFRNTCNMFHQFSTAKFLLVFFGGFWIMSNDTAELWWWWYIKCLCFILDIWLIGKTLQKLTNYLFFPEEDCWCRLMNNSIQNFHHNYSLINNYLQIAFGNASCLTNISFQTKWASTRTGKICF